MRFRTTRSDRPTPRSNLSSIPVLRAAVCLALLLLPAALAGCVEICAALDCGFFDNDNGGSSNDNGPPHGNGNDNSAGNLRVTLSISNTNPVVGEEVVFVCRVTSGDAGDLPRFEFQPARTRLVVDERQGVARFIVDAVDVGVQFTVTCTVTTATGATSPPSNSASFIASGSEP